MLLRIVKKSLPYILLLVPLALLAATGDGTSNDIIPSSLDPNSGQFYSMMQNLSNNMEDVYPMVQGFCYLLGVFMVLKGMFMLKKLGYKTAFMHAGSSMVGPAAVIMIGVIMMYAPEFLRIMFFTLYGDANVANTKSWVSSHSGSDTWYHAIKPAIGVVQVVGLCSFIRGWVLMIKSTGENAPPGNIGKGMMHIFGGVMAINITGTIDMINKSLGI